MILIRRGALPAAIALALGVTSTLSAAEDSTNRLDTIRVSGDVDDATEGTGAYKTRSATSATRMNLELRETPQSVSVITREVMDDFALVSLSDAVMLTTGILPQENDTERVSYYSRGYAINNFQVDGLLTPMGTYNKLNPDTTIYDRIELVRGATGLTTGAGDPSGTINLIRKRPGQEFALRSSVSLGRWDYTRVEADIGGPLALDGRLRARLVAAYHDTDSFRDNYHMEKIVAYGILEFDVTDDTLLSAGYEYQDQYPDGATWGTTPYWGWDPASNSAYRVNMPRSTNLSARWSSWPTLARRAFVTLDHAFNERWHAKLAYSHNRRDVDGKMFYGGNGYPRPDGSGITVWTSYFVGEEESNALDLNINGQFDLFGRSHDLMVGYGHFDSDNRAPHYDTIVPAGYADEDAYNIIPDWRSWDGGVPEFGVRKYDSDSEITKITQSGFYLATRINVTDAFKAVLGARLSTYDYDYMWIAAPGEAPADSAAYKNKDVVTPYAGLLYDFTPWLTGYVSYTEIFKPQDYVDRSGRVLDPITGVSYEVGLKAGLFDDQLNINAAVFRSEQNNMAELDDSVPEGSLPGGRSAYRSTGDGNEVNGWEIELVGALTPQWNIISGYTRVKAENARGVQINTTQPEDLFRLGSTYRFTGALEGLSVGGSLSWQSEIWRNGSMPVEQRPDGSLRTVPTRMDQASVALVGLMASYRFSDALSMGVNVTNLFDKEYYRNVGFYSGVHWGDPRSYTVNVRWQM